LRTGRDRAMGTPPGRVRLGPCAELAARLSAPLMIVATPRTADPLGPQLADASPEVRRVAPVLPEDPDPLPAIQRSQQAGAPEEEAPCSLNRMASCSPLDRRADADVLRDHGWARPPHRRRTGARGAAGPTDVASSRTSGRSAASSTPASP